MRAFNAATGRQVWRAYVGGRILGPAVVIGNLVFFSTLETKTYAVRASDGKRVWKINLGKYSPLIATNRHYYMTLNGLLIAFRGTHSPPEQKIVARKAAGGASARAVTAVTRRRSHAKHP
jgi:outer membrane protein assembly factor BamB